LAAALSIVLTAGTVPGAAFADDGRRLVGFGEIIEFNPSASCAPFISSTNRVTLEKFWFASDTEIVLSKSILNRRAPVRENLPNHL
jgi:hypothetical protein